MPETKNRSDLVKALIGIAAALVTNVAATLIATEISKANHPAPAAAAQTGPSCMRADSPGAIYVVRAHAMRLQLI